jgi:lysophospholipase-1
MQESAKSIGQLIAKEIDDGMDPGRVLLGGFSQGATMSLLTGLTLEKKLAGLVVLSGWLPMKDKFKSVSSELFF